MIYQFVAKRLGLRCDVQYRDMSDVDIPNLFCIFWKSKYITNDIVNERCFYILRKEYPNCLVDISSYSKCLVSRPPIYTLKSTKRIFLLIRMLNRQLIKGLVIYDIGILVRVKWDMLLNYTSLHREDSYN
ncbi:uncharacterized protein LOC114937301 [Nylanderia fulva]|uniref:uncharacterized protein LOC114937301 n=1 Tax=Nylanderia fulva TaxID=613905 RepID=UPI0010FB8758|nr:uncharacterized protein LOC114937301 [Nylanderia fulva]